MTTLICDCNKTMPLEPALLGAALNEELTLHSTLCRREAGAFVGALKTGEDLVVACTQEQRLFSELAEQSGANYVPIRFVNIRETGGWSKEGALATPKIAALLAAARLPEAEPVSTVSYKSAGRLLIIGALTKAEQAAELLADVLDITLFAQGPGPGGGAQERRYPVLAGQIQSLNGWLGAFELRWQRNNPIDLDLCTRCNACVAACPESAIGLDYQINLDLCQSHRDCVKACGVAGAIDFSRLPADSSDKFDLVLDLRSTKAFGQHSLPQGYFWGGGGDPKTLTQLRGLVGEFEKPKFFNYKQKLCAHSRNTQTGCSACIDVCSALAISSDSQRQQIKVNPNLCVGCGACTTVCPTGALGYAYPRVGEQGVKMKTLLSSYARAGGKNAALLLHSQQAGAQMLNGWGRAARLDKTTRGVPARVLPLALWHTASFGLDLYLSAIAYGASQVVVLMTGEEAPEYHSAVRAQMDVAQALLSGLGYAGQHFKLLQVGDAGDGRGIAQLDAAWQVEPAQSVARAAGFAVQADKRATLELALDHLLEHAPPRTNRPDRIVLPATGSPFGGLAINKDSCTLCLSCVSACPAGALQDNPNLPQLRFIEKNCVQCGLCVKTCPESALSLLPQLSLTPQRKEAMVLNESQPYSCVRCSKPFGTLKAIEGMLGKLSGHAMFQGAALERLKMCSDCRVIDLYSADNESKITDL